MPEITIDSEELSKALLTAYRNGEKANTSPFRVSDAISHLQADLVWSDDFDSVRDSLAMLLEKILELPAYQVVKLEPALAWFLDDLLGD